MEEQINKILSITESYQAPASLLKILFNEEKRNEVFLEFLELFKWNLSYEWFYAYFQDEHADRKKKKQDFTPQSVSNIINGIVKPSKGIVYEAAAGTGGICINHWHKGRTEVHPLNYKPSDYLFICEELSDRAIPFLILNMAIRGINAVVIHCDVLTREAYGVIFIQNDYDDPLHFSKVNIMPYNADTEDFFNVRFVEQRYPAHIESDKRLLNNLI